MFKKVLFCVPPFPNKYGLPAHPHTGIGYLCESLNANNIETAVIDFRLGNGYRELNKKINDFNPDLFGVSMMTYYHNLAYEIVNYLRQYNIPIAVGGPHVSTLQKKVLEECLADFGFIMEAEKSLVELCKGKPFESIPGLIYRRNEKLLHNIPQVTQDLDSIPFPKYADVKIDSYARKRIGIISSRGCPFQCIFCPINTVMGRRYRFRSAENIFSELEYWHRMGYRDFDFQDDNFTLDKNRVIQLCDMISKAGFTDLFMQCGNGIRADFVTRELLTRMRESGFKAVAFGVESANDEVLKRVKKGEGLEKIDNAIRVALESGLEVSLFFIVGLPGETSETFKDSIAFALKYPVATATFYNLIPFPGTELFEWVKANNYFLIQPKDYLNTIAHLEFISIFETPDFTAEERRNALIMGNKVNNIIKMRDLERKLGNIFVAKILSWLIYGSFFNKVLFNLIKIRIIKQPINYILLKLRFRINL